MGVLALAKNGDEQFWNMQNFMQPMGRLSTHSKCLDLFSFSFVGEGGGGFFFFFLLFPLSSQWVPTMFSKNRGTSQCPKVKGTQ
jgi:hypothetical protein